MSELEKLCSIVEVPSSDDKYKVFDEICAKIDTLIKY